MLDWLHELFGNAPWLPALLWIITIIVVLGFVFRWIGRSWPKLRAFVRTMDALVGLPEFMVKTTATLKAQDDKIAEIHHETHNNDGSSTKDSVDRIELGVKGLYGETDELKTLVDGLHGRMDNVEREAKELASANEVLRHDFEDTKPQPKEKQ